MQVADYLNPEMTVTVRRSAVLSIRYEWYKKYLTVWDLC